jgi:hypothetical protein
MEIQQALINYKKLGEFGRPDNDRNNQVLDDFKQQNPTLSSEQTIELIQVLKYSQDPIESYFVADILYLYANFGLEFLEPMLIAGIHIHDPSYNRLFVRPCVKAFGAKVVAQKLATCFILGDLIQKIGIAGLMFWLRKEKESDMEVLNKAVFSQAIKTTNLIELYFYNLLFPGSFSENHLIPANVNELIQRIQGNKEYEDLLYNKLGWSRFSRMKLWTMGLFK